MRKCLVIAGLMSAAAPASAEVVDSSPNGFHIRHSVTVPIGADAAYSAFAAIGRWWNPEHSYSGDSSRLSLQAAPGGCFCESLAGGGIEHMRVTYADRPRRLLLTGGLGPLLYEAVAAAMDVRFEAEGAKTRVTMTYKAAGFATGGADKLAPLVDQVLVDQMGRYAASVRAE